MQGRANLFVVFSLPGIFLFSESNQRVQPNPWHVNGIDVADGLDVGVAHFAEAEARNMQRVTQFRKRNQADMMKRMPGGLVQRTRIAAETTGAKEAPAGPQPRHGWMGWRQ